MKTPALVALTFLLIISYLDLCICLLSHTVIPFAAYDFWIFAFAYLSAYYDCSME